jgi:5-methylcytosine-specific restriction endonuclease McrA
MTARRGTSNSNDRGSAANRRARREWLVATYRSDVVCGITDCSECEPSCRCYRCGTLLTVETVTVDRIIPGCLGGTYRRNNIRPACAHCNSATGGLLAAERKRATA